MDIFRARMFSLTNASLDISAYMLEKYIYTCVNNRVMSYWNNMYFVIHILSDFYTRYGVAQNNLEYPRVA